MVNKASSWECSCAQPWHRCGTHQYTPPVSFAGMWAAVGKGGKAKRKLFYTDAPLPKKFRKDDFDLAEFARNRPILDPRDEEQVDSTQSRHTAATGSGYVPGGQEPESKV